MMNNLKISRNYILLIFPLILLILGLVYRSNYVYYQNCVDPEAFYLFGGTDFASGKFSIAFYFQPGTPLMLFSAMCLKVSHFVFGTNSLIEDVIYDPEFYIAAVVAGILLLIAVTNYFLGLVVLKKTNNIFSALFIQAFPFASFVVVSSLNRLNAENMTLVVVTFLLIFLFKFLYDSDEKKKSYKYVLIFSIITGLGIAVKLPLVVLLFVPFFLMKGLLRKIIFSALSFVFFIIGIFPVLADKITASLFYNWVLNLFFHSGKYGTGSNSIISKDAFISNRYGVSSPPLCGEIDYI